MSRFQVKDSCIILIRLEPWNVIERYNLREGVLVTHNCVKIQPTGVHDVRHRELVQLTGVLITTFGGTRHDQRGSGRVARGSTRIKLHEAIKTGGLNYIKATKLRTELHKVTNATGISPQAPD